jgi:hypothetical protein
VDWLVDLSVGGCAASAGGCRAWSVPAGGRLADGSRLGHRRRL